MEEERRCKHCGGPLFHQNANVVFCPECFKAFRRWLGRVDEKVRSHESVSIFIGMKARYTNSPSVSSFGT